LRARALVLVIAVALAAGVATTACDRVKADSGRDAALQVDGAQFFRQELPPDQGGPAVSTLSISPTVRAGASGRRCSGATAQSGAAVALALRGDVGYWILPTGLPSFSAPDAPTFGTTVSFASALAAGPYELVAHAVDADGRFGPETTRPLTVTSATPSGHLVISLTWSNDADLDLHVVDPSGTEIYDRNINSYEPPAPGAPKEPPNTPHDGGVLDLDSNAGCVPDGVRAEHVVWTEPPPRGHYIVRVDTASLCGQPYAYWKVEAILDGVRLGGAEGEATEEDTRFAHERGAGVLALELDVP